MKQPIELVFIRSSLTALFILIVSGLSGQCTIADIFPVSLGMNTFEVTNILNSNKSIYSINHFGVEQKTYMYKPGMIPCCSTQKFITATGARLYFTESSGGNSDVKKYILTMMEFSTYYSSDQYDQCTKQYDIYLESLKPEFSFVVSGIITNTVTKEQIGVYSKLFKTEETKKKDMGEHILLYYSLDEDKNSYDFIIKYSSQ